jgi:hypothetical protein
VEDKPGFVAARDEHEATQAAVEDAGVPPDAAERRRVQAIVEDLALAASHAASLEVLRGGEHHDVLLGEKPLDPKFKELRRKAHSNRVQELELRELQKTAGMACNADVKAMLQGQCAAIAARVGHEALRLRLLAAPGTWGAKAVADDERLASLRAFTNPSDTLEEAADRPGPQGPLQEAHGRGGEEDALGQGQVDQARRDRGRGQAGRQVQEGEGAGAEGGRDEGGGRQEAGRQEGHVRGASGRRGGGGHRRRHQGAHHLP